MLGTAVEVKHKRYLMDYYTWTHQCWLTNKDLHSFYLMLIRELNTFYKFDSCPIDVCNLTQNNKIQKKKWKNQNL